MASILLSYKDHTSPTGGGAVHGFNVVEQLRRQGHTLYTTEPQTDARLTQLPRTLGGLGQALEAVDIIYMRCDVRPWDQALLRLNRRQQRRPVILEINAPAEEGFAYGDGWRQKLSVAGFRWLYHQTTRAADAVVCVSSKLTEHVESTYPISPHRVFTVPNGGNPSSAPPPVRTDGTFKVVWAGGGHWPWQALDTIREVGQLLTQRIPNAELHLYTDATLPAAANLRIHPPVPYANLTEVLRTMDAALCLYQPIPACPAGFYNSPLKLFDYMSAGLAVLGSNQGQIAEVIEDGVSGKLVSNSPGEVVDVLAKLAADPAARQELGAGAIRRVEAGWSWNHTGAQIHDIIERLLA